MEITNRRLLRAAAHAGLVGARVHDEGQGEPLAWHETTIAHREGRVAARADTRDEARSLLLARLRAGRAS